MFDGPIITKNGNRVHCYGTIRFWNVQERREVSRGATSVPGSFAMLSVIWRTVMSSARRAQKDVPLSRAAEDVGPYQRSGLRCRSRVVGRSVRGCPVRKRFHAEQLPYPGRLRCRLCFGGRDVLGAPRAWGRSAVAGRRGRRPLPAFRSTMPFESCGPFGSGMPREEDISRGTTSVPGSFAMSSVIW